MDGSTDKLIEGPTKAHADRQADRQTDITSQIHKNCHAMGGERERNNGNDCFSRLQMCVGTKDLGALTIKVLQPTSEGIFSRYSQR